MCMEKGRTPLKKATLTLIDHRGKMQRRESGQCFEVYSAVNTIERVVGSYLNDREVREIMMRMDINVKIKRPMKGG